MLIKQETLTKKDYIDYMQQYYNQLQNYAYDNEDDALLKTLSTYTKYANEESVIQLGKFCIQLGSIYTSDTFLKVFLMSTIKQLEYTDIFRSMNKQRCNTKQIIQIASPGKLESIFEHIQAFKIPQQSIELWLPEYGEKCKFSQSRLEPKAGYIHGIHGAIAPFSHYLLDDEFKTPVYYVPMNQSDPNTHYNLIEPDNLRIQSRQFQLLNEALEIPF